MPLRIRFLRVVPILWVTMTCLSASAATGTSSWTEAITPSPAADVTAVGKVFWICGADEMIASSADGGASWTVHHQTPNGQVLLHIAFVNDQIGHAAGKNGLLLSTTDGGQTWTPHRLVADPRKLSQNTDIHAFSFADANHGIAIVGDVGDINRFAQFSSYGPSPVPAAVELTDDGGDHWKEISAFSSEDNPGFSGVLAVAALDSMHYLMIRNRPNIEDAFVITADGGKSWKVVHQRDDGTNREFAKYVFVHGGEFWAFGIELLHREKGGGYGWPLVEHSKDGEVWTHGVTGQKEFGSCNAQGCYMWDGAVEALYGAKEQYWNVPQDGSLSNTWAIAGDRVCTVGTITQCGDAIMVDAPDPSPRYPPHSPSQPFKVVELPFAPDCVACGAKVIRLDPGMNWQGKVVMTFRVGQDGSVVDWSEGGAPRGPLGALVEAQFKLWKFAPASSPTSTDTEPRHMAIDVFCVDEPEVPTMDGCRLTPGKVAEKARQDSAVDKMTAR